LNAIFLVWERKTTKLGAVNKRRPQPVRGSCPLWTSKLSVQNLFENYDVSAPSERGRVEAVRTFCGQGGGVSFFAI